MTRFHNCARSALSLLLLLAVLAIGGSALAAPAADHDSATPPAPLIVIGVGGLLWEDVDASETPALFDLVADSDLASLSVRTHGEITCPTDGWLTLATGRRTLAAERGSDPVCPLPSALETTSSGARVNWAEIGELNRKYGWSPRLGAFGTDLIATGHKTTAIGPGAGLALADEAGITNSYFATFSDFLAAPNPTTPDVLFLDAGNITQPGFTQDTAAPDQQAPSQIADRATQVRDIDQTIAELLQWATEKMPDANVLLFGPGGTEPTAHLTVLAVQTAASGQQWLRAESTRRDGVLTLTDLNPTLRDLLQIEPAEDAVGAPARGAGERGITGEAIAKLATDDAASHVIRDSLAPLMITLGGLNLAGLAAALLLQKRGNDIKNGGKPSAARRGAARRGAALIWRGFAALAIAPLATFIGSAMPWTNFPSLGLAPALILAIIASWVVLAAVVLLGPWRRHPLGPLAAAALITSVVLLIDSATGSHLQWVSPLGDTPLVAGRFYGISNPPFTLAYTGALIGLAIVCEPLLRCSSPRVATTTTIVFGAIFTVLVASPAAGANVGGTIAAVPGFIVLSLLVSQVKITRSGIGFMVFGGAFVFTVFALIDFAQPPEQRAHLGRFIARAGQGELASMLWRKIEASFTIVSGNLALTLIALLITGLLAIMIAFPGPWKLRPIAELYEAFPLLHAGVISALIGISIAVFTNDSGVALAFITLMILAPLLAAATVRYHFELRDG